MTKKFSSVCSDLFSVVNGCEYSEGIYKLQQRKPRLASDVLFYFSLSFSSSSSSKISPKIFYVSLVLTMIHGNMRPRALIRACPHMVLCLLLCVLPLPGLFLTTAEAVCNPQDRDSLLWLSGNLSSATPPLNWNQSKDCCSWEGIFCDDSPDNRVTAISLPSRGLSGNLPPSILNLSRLSHLNLSQNRLSGALPPGFFSALNWLLVLDLSFNGFNGELPLEQAIGNGGNRVLFPIQTIDLSSNLLQGEMPRSSVFLQGALNLTSFNVSNNSFTGSIPSFMCTSSLQLAKLDFSYNDFSGNISSEIGRCLRLSVLRAGFNTLTGEIPNEIYNLSELEQLFLPVNHFSGKIDDSVTRLTKLTLLELYSNHLEGEIPTEIGKLFSLRSLQLHINNLTGSIPPSLANCTDLVKLNLRVNVLGGSLSEIDFSRFQNLTILDLGNNSFSGDFPTKLYSCKSLTAIRLAGNKITGQISPEVLELESLSFMSLSDNKLTNISGALSILQGCKKLSTLIMAKNFYNETVPSEEDFIDPDGFQELQIFGIGGSRLIGKIPVWLIKLKNLEVLDISVNALTGTIPGWLGTLPNLFYMDISDNLLTGDLPKEIFQLRALMSQKAYDATGRNYLELPVFVNPNNVTTNQQYNQLSSLPPAIYIRRNNLTGSIPVDVGLLKVLHVLELSHNNLSGTIPDELANLTNLERLDLSFNDLSGQIPWSLTGLHFLSYFDVANNNLQGPIPTGGQFDTFPKAHFDGNTLLCGTALQRSCSTPPDPYSTTMDKDKVNAKLVTGIVIGTFVAASLVVVVLALWVLSKRRIIPGGDSEKTEVEIMSNASYSAVVPESEKDISLVLLFGNNETEVKDLNIFELLKATNSFSQANIIGCGGFGLVYKAVLNNGTRLAVKKLTGDYGLMEKEFKAEVEVLSRAKHENLVALQGYCMHEGCRILIYSFMENGSLDYWLHENPDGPSQLDWPKRLNIARGASCGLAYMHQACEPHIVHRDIKSSNILLDEHFKAHVGDFGLSRLILPYRTHVTTELVGTLGYIPPEYGQAWVATLRGDVYSFGVVMLELLTGKRPVEVFRPKMSRELVGWVLQMRSEGKQEEVFDPSLSDRGYEEQMLQVLDIACKCVNQNPLKRPSIQEVVDCLKNVGAGNINQSNRDDQERR
ncbi:PREDICTED: tyrosine-sulfated glycopeptide receptor 1-like [Tarenaya hassleriana]|uniref:tyrosine-sulfated glycopeptide receptor 1-like n=1 Tax=Tarenaya hassleriana TaxID=28532 RepID=UPI00053C54A2|nr:PREDICTED: tyrosine-sulfated glycopeptide receptor 1-like [Tarenaya hassleriana]